MDSIINNLEEKAQSVLLEAFSNPEVVNLEESIWLEWIFAKVYKTLPHRFSYHFINETYLCLSNLKHTENYDSMESYKKLQKEFNDSFRYSEYIFTEYGIIDSDEILLINDALPERIKKCLIEVKKENHFLYASVGNGGFSTRSFAIKELNDDILDNYNEDFPIDKFKNFLENEPSGIAIMNGIPGTGKSHMIRYFISKYPNKNFIWFDQSLLTQATSDSFVRFIIDNKNSILILEDCEVLLKSRDRGENGILNTVLNIADGIIGDSLNIKFICTFNTDYTNIDKAVIRKGRLKVKYEFKKLTKDRVSKLFNKFRIKDTPKEMPLCDIYNYEVVTGGEEKEKTKLGF